MMIGRTIALILVTPLEIGMLWAVLIAVLSKIKMSSSGVTGLGSNEENEIRQCKSSTL